MADPSIRVTVQPDTTQLKEAFANIGKGVQEIVQGFNETMTPAFATLKASLEKLGPVPTQADYALQPADIATAFGVPLSVIAPPDQLKPIPGLTGHYTLEPKTVDTAEADEVPVFTLSSWAGKSQTIQLGSVKPELIEMLMGDKIKAQDKAITQLATDLTLHDEIVMAQYEDGTIGVLEPGTYQVEGKAVWHDEYAHPASKVDPGSFPAEVMSGSGDPFANGGHPKPFLKGSDFPLIATHKQAKAYAYDVLGKAMPVVVHQAPAPMIQQTDLGQITVISATKAQVKVSGAVSTDQGVFELSQTMVLPIQHAKQMIGLTDADGSAPIFHGSINGQMYRWEPGEGWTLASEWSTPVIHHDSVPPSAPKTFQPPYGWFCTACKVHWSRHTGDPVACDSGGYVREASSAEHKLALLQQ